VRVVAAGFTIGALACASENLADWNQPGLLSPNGRAKARVMQMDSVSQVWISFDRGRCGGGSVSTLRPNADIGLSWRDSMTLEVSVPVDLALQPAPASSQLDHRVQCYGDVVNVTVHRR